MVTDFKPLRDAPICAWCIESTDSADWCWSATLDGVIYNARFLDAGCTPGEPFAVIRQADHQAQVNALLARLDAAEADARRYRWLRDSANDTHKTAPLVFLCNPRVALDWGQAIYGENLDSAIDAALKGA